MAVDVDDRKLRPRHRMLRHDQRRARLVLADGGRRESGSRPSAGRGRIWPGRLLRAGRRAAARTQAPTRSAIREASYACGSRNIAASRKPNSVRLSPARALRRSGELQRDDHSSRPAIAGGLKRPTRRLATGRRFPRRGASLFGLAPCGVLPATRVTTGAVRSYRTFSPLLAFALRARRAAFGRRAAAPTREAVCFLCHFPSSYPDRALPGALPCGVRTFLPLDAAFGRSTATGHERTGSLRAATQACEPQAGSAASASRRLGEA